VPIAGRSWLVVVNPSSGRRGADALAAEVADALEAAGADGVEVRTTAAIEDASRWAGDAAAEGFGGVAVVGGDGTVTAVAGGLLRAGSNLPIAIVPAGTGNGMARVLGLPMEPTRAIEALVRGRSVPFDAIEVLSHDRWGLMFVGAGLDAEINRDADATQKRRFGFLAYVGAAVRNLVGRRNRRIALGLDGRVEHLAAHTVTIINAGLMELAGVEVGPPTDPHDGRVEVALFRSPSAFGAAAQTWRLLTRRPARAELLTAAHVRLESRLPFLVHVDGDVIGTTPLEVRVRRDALTFVAAAEDLDEGGAPEVQPRRA
jgi:diacylglycerol kinase (ATP)